MINKAYLSAGHNDKHFSESLLTRWPQKSNWHRYGTELRHYHPIYSTKNLLKHLDSLLQLIKCAVEYFITATVEHYFRRGHTVLW